jgi:hypothetical protein
LLSKKVGRRNNGIHDFDFNDNVSSIVDGLENTPIIMPRCGEKQKLFQNELYIKINFTYKGKLK